MVIHSSGKLLSYYYQGKCWDENHPAEQQARDDKVKHLQELYNQGLPFFNKKVFRKILDQLDHCRANPRQPGDANRHIITIPALDGSTIRCELETGHTSCSDYPIEGTERVARDPHLDYRTFHQMIDIDRFSMPMAYCSTSLLYPEDLRRLSTKEFLPRPNLAPVDYVQAVFDVGIKAWEASEECQRLRSVLETTRLPKITKVIAFANSTMAVAGSSCSRSSQQHALMLTMRDIANRRRTTGQPEVRCFAQDPMYSEADEQVLQKAGVTVLGDPRGFLEVDDETVVLSFCPNIPVRQIIADIARPAVMIWSRIRPEAEDLAIWKKKEPDRDPSEMYSAFTDPTSPRLRDMVQQHYHEAMLFGNCDIFTEASVYVRRKGDHVGDAKEVGRL